VAANSKWNDQNAGPIRAFGWPLVVQAGGLAQLSGERLQLTTAGRKALAAPAAETKQRIYLNSSVPENVVELLCDAPLLVFSPGSRTRICLEKRKGEGLVNAATPVLMRCRRILRTSGGSSMSLTAASSGALAHSMSKNTAFCEIGDCRSETFCRSTPRRVVALRGPRQVGGDAPLHGRGDKVVEVPRDVFRACRRGGFRFLHAATIGK
jgi:hypothetical protein